MNPYLRYQEGVVKSILARPEAILEVVDKVDGQDFEDVNFRLVYESIIDLFLEKKDISLPEIALKIGESGGVINTGWLFNLENNVSDWIQAATPSTWAKLLKKESAKFKAVEVLKEGIQEINKESSDPLYEMDRISSLLTTVSVEATSGESYSIEDAIDRFKNQSQEIIETGGKISSITSAYPSIDFYTQGWSPTQLITVGARTGVGKSVFAINNAVSAMKQGKSVYLFSLEMTEREVLSRMIASLALITIDKVENAKPLTEDEQKRFNNALDFISKAKLVIDDSPHITVDHIKRNSIKQSQSENGLDFIIIDYLQLIGTNSRTRSRQEEVASISRDMKILAKELNVPVMVLVQLLREKRDDDGDQVPKLNEIRESGAIAQDSNVVILIHRQMETSGELIDPKAIFFIAKNRQGEANKYITVRTRLESGLFIDEGSKGKEVVRNLEMSEESEEIHFGSNPGMDSEDSAIMAGFDGDETIVFGDEGEDYFNESQDEEFVFFED